ncbi:MAG: hypothetical protein Q8Q04_01025 [archaeon]|nr:hypothetical protein [archaeon]
MKKKIFWGIVIGLTIIGTWGGSEKTFLFYNVKSGTSWGINLGFLNQFQEGSIHNGLNISVAAYMGEGSIHNGINLSIFTIMKKDSKVRGVNLSLFSFPPEGSEGGVVEGVEIGIIGVANNDSEPIANNESSGPISRKVEGVQINLLYNTSIEGPTVQIGVYNAIYKNEKWHESLLCNF